MPRYLFQCGKCQGRATLRRAFNEMDDPAESLCCGAEMSRVFTTTDNIHIPVHMQMKHGGGLSWSDFHSVSERELAKVPGLEPANRARSRAGFGKRKESKYA